MKKFNYVIAIVVVIGAWLILYSNPDGYAMFDEFTYSSVDSDGFNLYTKSNYLDFIGGKLVLSYTLFCFSKIGADIVNYNRKLPIYMERNFLNDLAYLIFIKLGLINVIGGIIGGAIGFAFLGHFLRDLTGEGNTLIFGNTIVLVLATLVFLLGNFIVKMLEKINND
ncbi:hypothetical protein RN96_09490 [Fusobacterium polymorphum]|uniref:Uncharacterized protein n=1 Tax=Fusobacterium nucleatum subsp. polymorphum TaxID=76857 RepID=A0A2B7YJH9_FUSNP|nr:hypothetical protein [Fusobacterium polymorphum]PGH21221.1 hypothetical protein RN96_09490 [Fusobacterium polymorphum]